jgi:hypothetical protein
LFFGYYSAILVLDKGELFGVILVPVDIIMVFFIFGRLFMDKTCRRRYINGADVNVGDSALGH